LFPELESLVLNPLDYGRVVRKVGNETDLTLVDLSDILPAATIMVVTTASTTSGKSLDPESIQGSSRRVTRSFSSSASNRRSPLS